MNLFLRWGVNSLGLWIAATVFSTVSFGEQELVTILIGGLILAVINAVIKPIVVVFSLPAIMLSLGLFIVIINGLMILLLSWLYGPLDTSSFGGAIVTGLVIGLVNFIVTKLVEPKVKA